VGNQGRGQSRRDRLPADGFAFLVEPDEALLTVEVRAVKGEGAAAAAGRFRVQSQDEEIQVAVVAGASGYLDDLGEARGGNRAAGAGLAPGFGDAGRGIVGFVDQPVRDRVPIETAQGRRSGAGRRSGRRGRCVASPRCGGCLRRVV
jgi:hypothetical protein